MCLTLPPFLQRIPGLTTRAITALAGIVNTVGVDLVSLEAVHRPLHALLSAVDCSSGELRFRTSSAPTLGTRAAGGDGDSDGAGVLAGSGTGGADGGSATAAAAGGGGGGAAGASTSVAVGASSATGLPVVDWAVVPKRARAQSVLLIRLVSSLWRCVVKSSTSSSDALFDAFYNDGLGLTDEAAPTSGSAPSMRAPSFVLLDVLLPFVSEPGKMGAAARACVLRMVRSKHTRLQAYMTTNPTLLKGLCVTLGVGFVGLCSAPPQGGAAGAGAGAGAGTGTDAGAGGSGAGARPRAMTEACFYALLEFADAVSCSTAAVATWLPPLLRGQAPDARRLSLSGADPGGVSGAFLHFVHAEVVPRVQQALLDGSEEELTNATSLVSSMLRALSASSHQAPATPLHVSLLVALVGPVLLPPHSGASASASDAASSLLPWCARGEEVRVTLVNRVRSSLYVSTPSPHNNMRVARCLCPSLLLLLPFDVADDTRARACVRVCVCVSCTCARPS